MTFAYPAVSKFTLNEVEPMKNGKERPSLVQMLGLDTAESKPERRNDAIIVHRYVAPHDHLCRVELVHTGSTASFTRVVLTNFITQHISKLLRAKRGVQVAPLGRMGDKDPTSFLSHYVEPVGSTKVERKEGSLFIERTDSERRVMAAECFRALEQAFKSVGLRLESLTVRFGRTQDGGKGRLVVLSLFDPRDWVIWRGTERMFATESKLDADYTEVENSTRYWV